MEAVIFWAEAVSFKKMSIVEESNPREKEAVLLPCNNCYFVLHTITCVKWWGPQLHDAGGAEESDKCLFFQTAMKEKKRGVCAGKRG